MKNSVEIVAFIKSDASIKELLKEFSHVKYVEDCNSLIDVTKNLNYMKSHVLIIDIDYCFNETKVIKRCPRKSLVHKGFSIILYSDAIISLKTKIKAYSLDFKGIIDTETEDKKSLLKHVLNRSNLHAATFENNFIRGVLEFHDLDKCTKNATYLLDYIVYKYNLSDKDVLDIHLVLCALTIAFKTDNILKVERLLNTIFKSESVSNLYQNYRHPSSINGSYIAIILKLVGQSDIDEYLSTINMKNVDATLSNEIGDIYKKKFIYISSLQDINSFWEQISNVTEMDDFLSTLYAVLLQSLLRVHYMRAFVAYNSEDMIVYIDQFEDKDDALKQHIESQNLYPELVKFNENRVEITLKNSDKVLINSASTENIQEKNTISALEFLKEYSVDQDILADLAENEEDIITLLFVDENVSQKAIESVSLILEKYANLLFETVEFSIIAEALSLLSQVLKNSDFDTLEESKKERLRFYLEGSMEDLKAWKENIFIEPNTPDIHYMDDSFVNNCSTIIKLINSKQEEANDAQDEDDLEFF